MMSELRFQCLEVEKMHAAREGLLETKTILLGQVASARHGVREMARRSHLLQRIIHYMQAKARKHTYSCLFCDIPLSGWALW